MTTHSVSRGSGSSSIFTGPINWESGKLWRTFAKPIERGYLENNDDRMLQITQYLLKELGSSTVPFPKDAKCTFQETLLKIQDIAKSVMEKDGRFIRGDFLVPVTTLLRFCSTIDRQARIAQGKRLSSTIKRITSSEYTGSYPVPHIQVDRPHEVVHLAEMPTTISDSLIDVLKNNKSLVINGRIGAPAEDTGDLRPPEDTFESQPEDTLSGTTKELVFLNADIHIQRSLAKFKILQGFEIGGFGNLRKIAFLASNIIMSPEDLVVLFNRCNYHRYPMTIRISQCSYSASYGIGQEIQLPVDEDFMNVLQEKFPKIEFTFDPMPLVEGSSVPSATAATPPISVSTAAPSSGTSSPAAPSSEEESKAHRS